MTKVKMTTQERFTKGLVKKNGTKPNSKECWLWTNGSEHKYGLLGDGNGSAIYAHRVSWELTNGAIPEGMCVSHSCNVRNCVNPRHLMLATPAANTAFMFLCGRDKKYSDKKPIQRMTKEEKFGIILNRLNGKSFYWIAKTYGRRYQHVRQVYERWLRLHSNDLIDVIQQAQDNIALQGIWV